MAFGLIDKGLFATAIKKPYHELSIANDHLSCTHNVLRHIMDSVPQSIFWKDSNSVYLGCNRNFALRADVAEPDHVIGKTDFDLPWSREQSEGYRADDRQVIETGQAKKHITEALRNADGSVIWLDTSKIPLTDEFGRVVGVLGVFEDVTSRKLADEQLQESLTFNQEIISCAQEGIVVYDRALRYLIWNPFMETLSGVPAVDILGKHPLEVFPFMRETGAMEGLEKALAGEATLSAEFPFTVPASGRSGWTFNTAAPLRNSTGEIIGVIRTIRDITRQKVIEDQLRQSQKLESVGRLAGGVAHDFNNKLTVIMGYAQILRKKIDDEQQKEQLARIIQAAEQSRDITSQLLAFSRQQAVSPLPFNANMILADLCRSLARLIGEDIGTIFVPGDDLWNVNMDPVQLDQIIMNLVVNARDAMPDGGTITIETENALVEQALKGHAEACAGEYVRITVRDTGTGMNEETRTHIFEPFFTTKELGKGTGLGLATVYGIVTQNGGFIDVTSTPGEGSDFTLYLPRYTFKVAACTPEIPLEHQPGAGTVLLVEDEEAVRLITASMLESLGYTCIAVSGAMDALDLVRDPEVKIDLVLTDVLMPQVNGREMVKQIHAVRRGIRTLYMSGYNADIVVDKTSAEAAPLFIKKPFKADDLAAAIRTVMETYQPPMFEANASE
jgi:PAS domain S-box-containing protein